jgi:hypothetical protein
MLKFSLFHKHKITKISGWSQTQYKKDMMKVLITKTWAPLRCINEPSSLLNHLTYSRSKKGWPSNQDFSTKNFIFFVHKLHWLNYLTLESWLMVRIFHQFLTNPYWHVWPLCIICIRFVVLMRILLYFGGCQRTNFFESGVHTFLIRDPIFP